MLCPAFSKYGCASFVPPSSGTQSKAQSQLFQPCLCDIATASSAACLIEAGRYLSLSRCVLVPLTMPCCCRVSNLQMPILIGSSTAGAALARGPVLAGPPTAECEVSGWARLWSVQRKEQKQGVRTNDGAESTPAAKKRSTSQNRRHNIRGRSELPSQNIVWRVGVGGSPAVTET